MKRYDSYKPGGVAWISKVPSHWEFAQLRKFLSWVSIKGHADKQLLSVTREHGVIVRNIDSKEENHNFIPDDLSNYKLVKVGQFVINKMKSWQGSYGVSNYEGIVSPAYYVYDLDFPNKRFFSWAIRSKAYIPFFTQMSKGIRVDQWDLSIDALKSIPFFCPPSDEQEAIVEFLDSKTSKIDRYIAERQREVCVLEELSQAQIARAVTLGLNPDAPTRDSGIPWLGRIPAHWKKLRFKEILHQKDIRVGIRTNLQLLSLTKSGVIFRNISDGKGKFPKDFESYKEVFPGDLILCLFDVDETPRTVGISSYHGMITGAYDIFEIRNVNPEYLLYTYQTFDDHKSLRPLYKGLRKVIPLPSLMSVSIYVPPLEEQQAIVDYINAKTTKIDRLIADLSAQIEKLKEYKQQLIADAVTGQIDVRN